MQLYFPDNIFARVFFDGFVDELKEKVNFLPSSILSKTINDNKHSAALIPTLELITNKDLFVSKSVGISFTGQLSNSFIYYEPGLKEVEKIKLLLMISNKMIIIKLLSMQTTYKAVFTFTILQQAITEGYCSQI